MDDEDFETLIALVERRLMEVGAGELADATLYMCRNSKSGEREVLPPHQRLIEMLGAFERHMKVRDITTYDAALKRINTHLREGFVEGAVVEFPSGVRPGAAIRLADAPSLAEPRKRLQGLTSRLRDLRRPGETQL